MFYITHDSRRFALVQPIQDATRLNLEKNGLDVLRRIKGPVAPVVVIGPYRSGKSFLLNQLLGVGCGERSIHHGFSMATLLHLSCICRL